MDSHSIFIGDQIQRALEIIEDESEEYEYGELINDYADGQLDIKTELRGNYLYVEVEDGG